MALKRALVYTVLISGLAAVMEQVGGVRLTPIGWLAPLTMSIFILLSSVNIRPEKVVVWLPWTAFILTMVCFSSSDQALTRAVIMVTPYFVGAAAGCVDFRREDYPDLIYLIKATALLSALIVAVKVTLLEGNSLSFLPTESISSLAMFWILFQHWLLFGGVSSLVVLVCLTAVPVASVSRTALFALILSIPSSCGGRSAVTKALPILTFLALCAGVLALPQVQRKMVYEGHTLSEAWANPTLFQTSGRLVVWKFLLDGFLAEPVLGNGANSTETISHIFETSAFDHPHNDWLRLLYEYGLVGTSIFVATAAVQISILRRRWASAPDTPPYYRALCRMGALLFIPFFVLMLTDNVLFYGAYFGNLHFLIVGISNSITANRISTSGKSAPRGPR